MNKPRRGEVWYANFEPVVGHEQGGRRPCVILTADAFNLGPAGIHTVVPITSKPRPLPTRVHIAPPEGDLPLESWAIPEQIRTISMRRLREPLGRLTPETMRVIEHHLRRLLGL